MAVHSSQALPGDSRVKRLTRKLTAFIMSVIDFGTNRKLLRDFLLVINGNLGPISHRIWDTVNQFLPRSYLRLSVGVTLSEFLADETTNV